MESRKGFQATRQSAIHEDIGFNKVVAMDMAFWTGKKGVKYGFVHVVDEETLFQQNATCQETSTAQFQAFQNCWLSWAGPPKELHFDPATEYSLEAFLTKLQEEGISGRVTARDNHRQFWKECSRGWMPKVQLNHQSICQVPSSSRLCQKYMI